MNKIPSDVTKRWDEAKNHIGYDISQCTCIDCTFANECDYAYDLYNTNGECLYLQ